MQWPAIAVGDRAGQWGGGGGWIMRGLGANVLADEGGFWGDYGWW